MPEMFTKFVNYVEFSQTISGSETIRQQIIRQITGRYRKEFTNNLSLKLMGSSEHKGAEIIVTELQLPITVDEYMKCYRKLCKKKLGDSPLLKGAARLLTHLSTHNIPFALATASGEDMVEIKTSRYRDLFNLFNHQVCGSSDKEVKQCKPAPDVFLVAASRFPEQPSPEKCLAFEDAPNGVKAAVAAGMQVIMVPHEHVPALLRCEATQVLKSLQHFQPEQFGLPPYPKFPQRTSKRF